MRQSELKPCGTWAAYIRHLRRGETPCEPCREAQRSYTHGRLGKPCSECGQPRYVSTGSLAEPVCHDCRRSLNPPKLSWVPQFVTCPCGVTFEQRRYGQKYCCPGHRPDRTVRRRTAARGYGGQHRAERERLLAAWRPGDPCAHCGEPIWGPPIDLGHTADRSGWTGLEHRRCNRSEGARRGNGARMRTTNGGQVEQTLKELRRLGRLERIDAALVQMVRSQAHALDADPGNAALWRQYREALRELTADDDAGGSFEEAAAELYAEMGDAAPS